MLFKPLLKLEIGNELWVARTGVLIKRQTFPLAFGYEKMSQLLLMAISLAVTRICFKQWKSVAASETETQSLGSLGSYLFVLIWELAQLLCHEANGKENHIRTAKHTKKVKEAEIICLGANTHRSI